VIGSHNTEQYTVCQKTGKEMKFNSTDVLNITGGVAKGQHNGKRVYLHEIGSKHS
jgi:hypothetical protein